MPRVAILPQYTNVAGETPPRSPTLSPASSPVAGISSRSASPSSPRSPLSKSRHSAFSLVHPKDFHRGNKNYLTVNGEWRTFVVFTRRFFRIPGKMKWLTAVVNVCRAVNHVARNCPGHNASRPMLLIDANFLVSQRNRSVVFRFLIFAQMWTLTDKNISPHN